MSRSSVKQCNVFRVGLTAVIALAVTTSDAAERQQPKAASTNKSSSSPQVEKRPQDYRASVLSAEFPYESKYVEVLGSKMHHIDQGKGDVFLFLHGNPTSSYLWRNVMRYVAPHGRIVAVDNLGVGKSDKPDVDYTFQTQARYTEEFIGTLNLKNVILVVHDWGSAIRLDYAATPARNVLVVERIGQWLRNSETPKLLQYASPGVFIPPKAADWAAQNFRNIETQFVGYGRHFIQEDNPEAIGRGIVDWYRRLETDGHDSS